MAAHLEGLACSVFDMTGLSQKNGAVYSHVRIAAVASDLAAQKLGTGEADLALAFDAVAALAKEPVVTLSDTRTTHVVHARITPPPVLQRHPALRHAPNSLVAPPHSLSPALPRTDEPARIRTATWGERGWR